VERVRRQREREAESDKPINIIQWHSGVVTPMVTNNNLVCISLIGIEL